jgi:hypothetical protein
MLGQNYFADPNWHVLSFSSTKKFEYSAAAAPMELL